MTRILIAVLIVMMPLSVGADDECIRLKEFMKEKVEECTKECLNSNISINYKNACKSWCVNVPFTVWEQPKDDNIEKCQPTGWCSDGYHRNWETCECVKDDKAEESKLPDNLYMITSDKAYQTKDGGKSWQEVKSQELPEKIFTEICSEWNDKNCKYVVSEILEKRGKMWLIRREKIKDSKTTVDTWVDSEKIVWEPYEL